MKQILTPIGNSTTPSSGSDIDGLEIKIDTVDTVVDAIKLKTDTIPASPLGTANIAVPTADVADNVDVVDVVGNKSDTVAGTSLVALIKQTIADTIKIDEQAVLGLLGTSNSLAYRLHELERHFHSYGKWFGAAAVPDGETHVADRMGPSIAGFSLVSGNNAFGNWVQILGSSDTPVKSGNTHYDLHKVIVTNANDTNPFLVQIVCGESADIAANIAAEDFTEFPYEAMTNQINSGSFDVLDRRCLVGTKAWARCICIGSNAKTIVCYFGLHEYEG